MQRSDIDFILDIKAECKIIIKHTRDKNLQDLLSDEIFSRAIERSLEIIGEATKHVSELTKLKYPEVEWKKIAGLRDVIIHQYFGVDYDLIWDVVVQKIPGLHHEIIKILKDTPR